MTLPSEYVLSLHQVQIDVTFFLQPEYLLSFLMTTNAQIRFLVAIQNLACAVWVCRETTNMGKFVSIITHVVLFMRDGYPEWRKEVSKRFELSGSILVIAVLVASSLMAPLASSVAATDYRPKTHSPGEDLNDHSMTIDTNPTGLQVKVNGTDYMAPYSFSCPNGTTLTLEAITPQYPGALGERYAWSNWSDDGGQTHDHVCTSPATITANYVLQYSVNVTTNPVGYPIRVDGSTYATTPQRFWWNETSNHTLEALDTIALGSNDRLNFSFWSDFGARVHSYWANTSETLTAFYDFQHRLVLQGNYPGLSIRVDGYSFILNNQYWCNHNEQVLLEADTYQYSGDTRYVFESWSDGGAQIHFITCDAPIIVIVYYGEESRVVLSSTLDGIPSNLIVTVDGTDYITPYSDLWWPANTQVQLGTYEFQPEIDPLSGARSRWNNWTEGGTMLKTVLISQPGMEFTANFVTQYKLTFVDPHGTPTTVPIGDAVADGFYFDEGTDVTISTDEFVYDAPDHRWTFIDWLGLGTGSYTGPNRQATITMNNPITQTAVWDDEYMFYVNTTIDGAPYSLIVLIDGMVYGTPAAIWRTLGSQVTLDTDVVQPEADPPTEIRFKFMNWTDLSSDNMTEVDITTPGQSFVANFITQYKLRIVDAVGNATATPGGDPVTDGSYYDVGATVTIETEDEVVVTPAYRFGFDGWVGIGDGSYTGSDNPATIIMNGPITQTASWKVEVTSKVYVNTTLDGSPAILSIIVDGMLYPVTPAEIWCVIPTQLTLDTIEFQPGPNPANGIRFKFVGWADLPTKNRTVDITTPGQTFVANFITQYRLTFVDDHGTPTVSAGDQISSLVYYVDIGSSVTISTDDVVADTADHRYRFDGWTGSGTESYTGPDSQADITMSNAITQTAAWMDQYLLTVVTDYVVPGASDWREQVSDSEFWYDSGVTATFWVPGMVYLTAEENERAVFESWTGVTPGTNNESSIPMSQARTVAANWQIEYLVELISDYDDNVPAETWVGDGTQFTFTIQDYVPNETEIHTRYRFDRWTSTSPGGYTGTIRALDLTITAPVNETALWVTQYELTITSVYGDEPETLGAPTGAGWYDEGATAWVGVARSVEKGDYVYRFIRWREQSGFESKANDSYTVVNGHEALTVEWSKEAKFDLLKDMWWVFVLIIVIVVVVISMLLLLRRRKPAEEEIPPSETSEEIEN
jgi:hypothetical protein